MVQDQVTACSNEHVQHSGTEPWLVSCDEATIFLEAQVNTR